VRASRLISSCIAKGLGGFEFPAGIPGTFGGVLWMDAGTRAGSVQEVFHSMTIVDAAGEVRTLDADQVNYRYRTSQLPRDTFILGGRLALKAQTSELIRDK